MPLPLTSTLLLGAALLLLAGADIAGIVLVGLAVMNQTLVTFLAPKVLDDDDR